jgi:hypothetical protein
MTLVERMGGQIIEAGGNKRTRIDRHSQTNGLLRVRLLLHGVRTPGDENGYNGRTFQEIVDEPC